MASIFDTGDSMHPSARAKHEGMAKEQAFEDLCISSGIRCVKYKDFKNQKNSIQLYKEINNNILIKSVPYESIYPDSMCRTEFVYYNRITNYTARIEIKKQSHPGSTDEKIPYILRNAQEGKFSENELILIFIGDAFREGMYQWIEEERKNIKMPIKVLEM